MVSLKLYSGRADLIVHLLDEIILKNDHIVIDSKRMKYIQSDPSFKDEDFGLKKKIEAFEATQRELAEEIAKKDKRGTIRAMLIEDYVNFLQHSDTSSEERKLAASRLATLGLIHIYRIGSKGPVSQTQIAMEAAQFPTTGRDYSMVWRNWDELAGAPYQRES